MNLVKDLGKGASIGVGMVEDRAAVRTLLEPGCQALIWRRQTPHDVQNWLDSLDPDTLPRGRVTLRPDALADTVGQLCDMAGVPMGAQRRWLETDITALGTLFADLMSSEFLRLRLDVIDTDACRKFHMDAVSARLICTYRGTGTQYGTSADENPPEHVFTVATGSPILLRGKAWVDQAVPTAIPAGQGNPTVLHRSPPISGSGETRLVAVIDPIFQWDGDA